MFITKKYRLYVEEHIKEYKMYSPLVTSPVKYETALDFMIEVFEKLVEVQDEISSNNTTPV